MYTLYNICIPNTSVRLSLLAIINIPKFLLFHKAPYSCQGSWETKFTTGRCRTLQGNIIDTLLQCDYFFLSPYLVKRIKSFPITHKIDENSFHLSGLVTLKMWTKYDYLKHEHVPIHRMESYRTFHSIFYHTGLWWHHYVVVIVLSEVLRYVHTFTRQSYLRNYRCFSNN